MLGKKYHSQSRDIKFNFLQIQVLWNKNTYTIIDLCQSRGILISEYGFTQKDWSVFREKNTWWQESYMDKLNKEYIELLSSEGKPSEKFWALEERIRNDKKDTGVQLKMSRSNCIPNIISLLNEGAITMKDLEEFSDELKETIHFITR